LSWSHWIEILSLKDINKIKYYVSQCMIFNLTTRDLRNRIKSNEYERLPNETKVKLMKKEEPTIQDLIPNPIVIKNRNNIEVLNEKILHQLILENIESFMQELGTGYALLVVNIRLG
jgi:predicted nuclease of restriction endonuclease-like (RecB) superfamily